MDGAPACPFVAFGDDRDGRSTSPDHRHRCFAESPPAPRAVAHQEAYCLSSAFPVCPTFQDWARREAAHARGAGSRPRRRRVRSRPPRSRMTRTRTTRAPPSDPAIRPSDATRRGIGPRRPRGPRRAGAAGRPGPVRGRPGPGSRAGVPSEPSGSEFLPGRSVEGQGLAGSAADRLAGGRRHRTAGGSSVGDAAIVAAPLQPPRAARAAEAAPHDELAGLAQGRPASAQTPPRTGADAIPRRR